MDNKRKLIKVDEFKLIMANGYQVEGTNLYVLELVMFGFAYSSYYILLRSQSTLTKLRAEDEVIAKEINYAPYKFGKKLVFGKGLDYDTVTQVVYYTGEY